jgi:signal transduction histidine kinase
VFGFLVQAPNASAASRKALKQNPHNRIPLADLDRALSLLNETRISFSDEIQQAKNDVIQQYKSGKEYEKEILEQLRPELEKNLAFLHDYRQFVSRVKQQINVVLQTRYGSGEIESLLAKAFPAEAAIYWASSLMTEKLQTAFHLLHPERLQSREKVLLRLHGMVTKYVRIYQAGFAEKGVKLEVTGESLGQIRADPTALGVIPQTLLDNALKYAQNGSKVTVSFKEFEEFIILEVASYGPRIEADEKEKIFDLFYRGRNAVKEQEEGTGFGLPLAQFVAKSIGSEIAVHQSSVKTRFGYETAFSVRFRREE